MREVTDPNILSQLNGGGNQPTGNMRPVEDPNILAQLNGESKSNVHTEEPSISERASYSLMRQQSPFAPKSNPEEEGRYNVAEKVGTTLMDYAPYFIGGSGITKLGAKALSKFPATAEGIAKFAAKHPKLAKYIPQGVENAIGSAGYGAATAEQGDTGRNALVSGAIGAAMPFAVGAPTDALLRYGAKKYAQSAIPKFTEQATEKLRQLLPTGYYSNKLSERFLKASTLNESSWNAAKKLAAQADERLKGKVRPEISKNEIVGYDAAGAPIMKPNKIKKASGIDFNNSPYKNYIKKYKNEINSLEPAQRQEYSQALNLANKAQKLSPRSFTGTMALRKNINQDMKEFLNKEGSGITPQNYKSKDFLRGLKENLKNETIQGQKGKVSPEDLQKLSKQWEKANKTHQQLQEFYKSLQPSTGIMKPTRQMRERFENVKTGAPLDPSIIAKYVPSLGPQGAQGTEWLKHLQKLLGSKRAARDAAKAHIFKDQIGNGAKTVDSAAQYAKLSDAQKKELFGNSKEGKMLESINKSRLAFGREPEKTLAKIGHGLMGWGVPGLLGYGASRASGENEGESFVHALEAMGAAKGLKALGAKTANIGRMNRAIKFGKSGTTNAGRNLNYLTQSAMNKPPEKKR